MGQERPVPSNPVRTYYPKSLSFFKMSIRNQTRRLTIDQSKNMLENKNLSTNEIFFDQRSLSALPKVGSWHYDVDSGDFSGCEECYSMLGSPRSAVTGIGGILRKIHLHSREKLLAELQFISFSSCLSLEIRLIDSKIGVERWVRIIGVITRIPAQGCKVSGYMEEISAYKLREKNREEFNEFFNHEIRTPLTTIQLYTQMIEKVAKGKGDVATADYSQKAIQQITALRVLADTYLGHSAIAGETISLSRKLIDMTKYLHEYTSDLQRLFPDRIFLCRVARPVLLDADPVKLTEVLNNLTGNAMKYGPPGGIIQIILDIQDGLVRIGVQDEGNGIPEEEQLNLFNRYYRMAKEFSANIKGQGLGLYIVKKIIELHGGSVGVQNNEGAAAQFYFCLPCSNH